MFVGICRNHRKRGWQYWDNRKHKSFSWFVNESEEISNGVGGEGFGNNKKTMLVEMSKKGLSINILLHFTIFGKP